MILVHIKETRESPLYRWVLALYDTNKKCFVSPERDDQILIYRKDSRFQKQLNEILEYFKTRGYTNLSDVVREQIFKKNGIPLPNGWRSFKI